MSRTDKEILDDIRKLLGEYKQSHPELCDVRIYWFSGLPGGGVMRSIDFLDTSLVRDRALPDDVGPQ